MTEIQCSRDGQYSKYEIKSSMYQNTILSHGSKKLNMKVTWKKEEVHAVWVQKFSCRRPLGRPTRRDFLILLMLNFLYLSFTHYTSIQNATRLLSSSSSHYMFWPYTANIWSLYLLVLYIILQIHEVTVTIQYLQNVTLLLLPCYSTRRQST
jgi:hypothetical protein